MSVVHRTVECYLEPILTVAGLQALHNHRVLSGILHRFFQIVVEQVTHAIGMVNHSERVHIPHTGAVDSRVEHEAQAGVPVTVDILRLGNPTTRLFNVLNRIRDGVSGIAIVTEQHDRTHVVLDECVIVQSQAIGERRLQARVTLGDVQRVAVVGDVKQVAHLRLLGCSAVVDTQLCGVVRTITEI